MADWKTAPANPKLPPSRLARAWDDAGGLEGLSGAGQRAVRLEQPAAAGMAEPAGRAAVDAYEAAVRQAQGLDPTIPEEGYHLPVPTVYTDEAGNVAGSGVGVVDIEPGGESSFREVASPEALAQAGYAPQGPPRGGAPMGPVDPLGSFHEGIDSSVRPSLGGFMYSDPRGYRHEVDRAVARGILTPEQGERALADPRYLQHAMAQLQVEQGMSDMQMQRDRAAIGYQAGRDIAAAEERARAADLAWQKREEGRRQLAALAREQSLSDFQQANDELANFKIKPEGSFSSETIPMRMIAVIGAAINGYVSAMTGQENVALKMLNDMVERDVDAQKTMLANKQQAVGNKRTAYGMLREKLGDDERASAMLRQAHWEAVANEVRGLKGQAASKAQLATIAKLEDDATRQAEAARHQAIGLGAQMKMAAMQARGGGAAPPKTATVDPKQLNQVIWSPSNPGQALGIIPGTDGKQVAELRDMVAGNYVVQDVAKRLQQLAGAHLVPGTQAASDFEQYFQLLRAPEKKELAGAAESVQEEKAINAIIKGRQLHEAQYPLIQRALGIYARHKDHQTTVALRVAGLRPSNLARTRDPRTGRVVYHDLPAQQAAPPPAKPKVAGWGDK